ncbi:GYDIA family GHMP kinase [Tenacibaculum sp. SG-28]|uniref:GYDIA family GHMP kinase n=1 Tax=Tenacibaculum sp. SG-28 TaxID=754426 RepID=UPI000CF40AC0|nr:GYDIA family GHMP kinase [Tenacibaculum sp. SG-28]PQJ21488.1 GHMP kinase [Tenacibaculum sp. SG-28]
MNRYYSNGKLLLTGEYVVLDGAKSLAVPCKFGQDLVINSINEPLLVWGSFTKEGQCWFEASFSLPQLRLVSATFNSNKEGSSEFIAETLQNILQKAKALNPNFLKDTKGYIVKTHLGFPQNWGLGSSSTLINNIANWAQINPYTLLWNAFSGSGYDIACAKHDSPIVYCLENKVPSVTEVAFNPSFEEELYFVHLNKKQNSREGIATYKNRKKEARFQINTIDTLTEEFMRASSAKDLSKVIQSHEAIISSIIQQKPVKEILFSDYFGAIKSLGAWGGDFILATGNNDTPSYFKEKGFTTIVPYSEMIL